MNTVAEMHSSAVQHYRSGDLLGAEQLFRQIVQADPAHADSHHMLGVLAYHRGNWQQAIEAFRSAIALDTTAADYRNNLGLALQSSGLLDEALASYRAALGLEPNMAEAHNNLGNVLINQGNSLEAIAHYIQALRLQPHYAAAYGGLGLAFASQGRTAEAAQYFQCALQLSPDDSEAHNNLASLYYNLGQFPDALIHCQHALRLQPDFPEAHVNLGNVYLVEGAWADAEESFRNALRSRPDHAEALHGLGVAVERQNRFADAADFFRRALRIKPEYAEAHYNLGNALTNLNNVDEAIDSFRLALSLDSNLPNACNNLGCALASQDKLEEAKTALQEAIRLQPNYAEAHSNLANALLRLGSAEDALAACQDAIRLKPDYASAYCNLGAAQHKLGLFADALANYEYALSLRPDYAEAYNGLGIVLIELGELDQAVPSLKRAVQLKPDFPEAHGNLAALLAEQGLLEEANDLHSQQALRLNPSASQEIRRATALPPIYRSSDDLHIWRQRLIERIRELQHRGVCLDLTNNAANYSFYPAYQGLNDRELQSQLATLYRPAPDPKLNHPTNERGGNEKVRVGFISRFFKEHTIARLTRGLIAQLSRDQFHVVVFFVGRNDDPMSNWIKQHADEHVEMSHSYAAMRKSIAEKQLDILFYSDIGMEAVTYTLAFSRLAPVQCVTWGHPVTTGIPTIDYFISSELLEGEDAEQHYKETLVKLKNLAVYYYRPATLQSVKHRAEFDLPESGALYLCPQTLFKLHPDFDEILAGILRRDPQGSVGLLQGKHRNWERLLGQRFAAAMPDVMDRILFIPPQSHADFMSLNALADVLLDPVHFGGGNTSYEGLALGVPIVTMPSPFLRGRITLALYKQMKMMDCVVSSPAEYIDLVLKLGTNRDFRASISAKILATNDVLFENASGVRELEEFLLRAVHKN